MPHIFDRFARDLDPAVPPIAVEHVMSPLSASLAAMGMAMDAVSRGSVSDALKGFQAAHHLPATGVLGHDDALEFAAALAQRGLPTAGFTAAVRAHDPEAFGHDIAWPVKRRGDKSTAVRLIQLRCNDLGFGALTTDGDFGNATDGAVRALQTAQGIGVDGVVGNDTWHALVEGMAILHQGDSGEAVGIAQRRLVELGYATFTPTGNFGPKTLAALHSFQTEAGLAPADAINEDTWRYLFGSTFGASQDFTAEKNDLTNRVATNLGLLPAANRTTVSSVMQAAIASYGIREKPEGSNRGADVDALVGTRGWAWCALSVSAWVRRGLQATSWAAIPFHQEIASANGVRAWGFAGDRFLPTANVPPGAIFIMNRTSTTPTPPSQPFSKGHTGFVVQDNGSSILTVEGNSHDAVRSVDRDKATIVGFIRWWG